MDIPLHLRCTACLNTENAAAKFPVSFAEPSRNWRCVLFCLAGVDEIYVDCICVGCKVGKITAKYLASGECPTNVAQRLCWDRRMRDEGGRGTSRMRISYECEKCCGSHVKILNGSRAAAGPFGWRYMLLRLSGINEVKADLRAGCKALPPPHYDRMETVRRFWRNLNRVLAYHYEGPKA